MGCLDRCSLIYSDCLRVDHEEGVICIGGVCWIRNLDLSPQVDVSAVNLQDSAVVNVAQIDRSISRSVNAEDLHRGKVKQRLLRDGSMVSDLQSHLCLGALVSNRDVVIHNNLVD